MGRSRNWSCAGAIACAVVVVAPNALATTHLLADFEGKACDAPIADAETLEGHLWDTYPGVPQPSVRCSAGGPSGNHFVEWHTANATNSAQVDITLTPVNLAEGSKVYLASFVRFERVGAADVWRDTAPNPYQFDKMIEFRGTGFRWGIGAGWNGEYSSGGDHQFTFDAWYSTVLIGDHGPDHIVADQSPYGASQAFRCDYEKWYGVVLGVTVASSNTGRVELWVDGTKLIDQAHYTASPSAVLETLTLNGTIGQPDYDSPAHLRQFDRLLVTNDWADVVTGKYLDAAGISPGGDAGGPGAPDSATADGGVTNGAASPNGPGGAAPTESDGCTFAPRASASPAVALATCLAAASLLVRRRRKNRS